MTNVLNASAGRAPRPLHLGGASRADAGAGPSAEACGKGNSNRELGLFDGVAKGVK